MLFSVTFWKFRWLTMTLSERKHVWTPRNYWQKWWSQPWVCCFYQKIFRNSPRETCLFSYNDLSLLDLCVNFKAFFQNIQLVNKEKAMFGDYVDNKGVGDQDFTTCWILYYGRGGGVLGRFATKHNLRAIDYFSRKTPDKMISKPRSCWTY